MRPNDSYKNKRVIIVGLARSGLACANLLYDLGAEVSVTDHKDDEATRAFRLKLKSEFIRVELGRHTPEFVKNKDLLVISPGVPNEALPVLWAKEQNIPVISEIELSWSLCAGTVIAITGSNGKTTVTTLIGRMLEAGGRRAFVCGNIGNPFAQEVHRVGEKDYVCLEVSSFQLENIVRFKPQIAVILNFTRNHLDRYKDMGEYLEAKKRIFMNQDKGDYAVLNGDDPVLKGLAGEVRSSVVFFSPSRGFNPNQAAVLCVGSILGIKEDLVLKVFKDFKGLQHRLEHVAEIRQVLFINDSKATTVDSAIWALQNISSPIVWIAGGKDKKLDYGAILDLAHQKVKHAVLIGEAKEKIGRILKGILPVEEAGTLEEAVGKAYQKASPGDCVLLSPMCSSYDMFSDYEERGFVFKKAVYDLAKQPVRYGT